MFTFLQFMKNEIESFRANRRWKKNFEKNCGPCDTCLAFEALLDDTPGNYYYGATNITLDYFAIRAN